MSIISFIVIALAFGLVNMLLLYRCGKVTPVRLSTGLISVIALSAIHVLFFYFGNLVGNMLSLRSPTDPHMYNDANAYIFLGITLAIIIKLLAPYLRKEPRLPLFDLGNFWSLMAMNVASGINVFLIGIGTGFVTTTSNLHKIVWPLLIASILLGYLGLMFGRQKVHLRARRWMIIACVLLLGVAIAAVVNA